MPFLFTSESVSEGHPDKICDQISDAVLDAVLESDPNSYSAVECFTTTGMIVIAGEMKTNSKVDVQSIARGVLKDIGYTNPDYGIDADSCAILVAIHDQSADIAQGVNEGEGFHKEQGAGDQGLMFGYACSQTKQLMPLPIVLSHELMKRCAVVRKSGQLSYLRPDAKAQVTIEYDDNNQAQRVDAIVISTQHHPDIAHETIVNDIKEHVIQAVIPAELLDERTNYYINPTGRFVIGGPHGDAGLTGRKIVVDTYGGWVPHGGGAFSGKDSTKVDRSAAYMARYVAKNCVAAGLAKELEIQVSYAIGVAKPVSIRVKTYGSSEFTDDVILDVIQTVFDFTPSGIKDTLRLNRPIYRQTATYGHFGRDDIDLPWEQCDKVNEIKETLKAKHVITI